MLTVAITGGIGSGKTTVANLFQQLGVAIIDADKIAHDLTRPNEQAFNAIVKHFGKNVLNADGTLNRRTIGDIVFDNNEQRYWLERTLHPLILNSMQQQIKKINTPYCLLVIPLLAETNNVDFADRILVVDAPESLQIQRTQQRSHLDKKTIHAMMQSQCTRQQRLAIADDVIVNDESISVLHDTVKKLHAKYVALAAKLNV